MNLSGRLLGEHFLSSDNALALTFTEREFDTESERTCTGEVASISDHG